MNIINQLVNGELNDLEKKDIKNHFLSCPACLNYYNDLLFIKKNLNTINLSLPDTFAKDTMKKIKIKKINYSKVFKYSASILAACFVAVIGFSIYHNGSLLTTSRSNKSADLAANPIYEESIPTFSENSIDDERAMAVAPKEVICDDISYDYLYQNTFFSIEEIRDILTKNFKITDFNVLDDCVIFNTDKNNINNIVDKLKLQLIEKDNSDITVIKVKILNMSEKK